MPSINMIAPRRAEKKRLERDMRRLVFVIMMEFIFLLGVGGWVFTRLLSLNGQIVDMGVELSKLQPTVRTIEEYEKATLAITPKLELLNQAKDRTMRWFTVLDALTQSLPTTTCLTRISTGASDKKDLNSVSLVIAGQSISQASVGDVMLRMQTIPNLQDISLHFTQDVDVGRNKLTDFEIGAVMMISDKNEGGKHDGRT